MNIEKLLVCDGHNIAYRSFYAIRNLSRSDGVPTNAVFGFVRQIEALASRFCPSHLVVVFDGGIPQRRLDLLDSYKAQRPHMPEELSLQMEGLHSYLRAARIADLQVEEEEADDVIATIAMRAQEAGAKKVLLATSDKDMLQLVTDVVNVCPPSGDKPPLDPGGVYAKIGVYPNQLVDWLALVGDTADNIPGISGVGPKTAAKLLGRFGSIEDMYSKLDEIERQSLREKLQSGRALLNRNIDLMRLDLAIPLEVDLEDFQIQPPLHIELLRFFEKMEFNRMAANLREPKLF